MYFEWPSVSSLLADYSVIIIYIRVCNGFPGALWLWVSMHGLRRTAEFQLCRNIEHNYIGDDIFSLCY